MNGTAQEYDLQIVCGHSSLPLVMDFPSCMSARVNNTVICMNSLAGIIGTLPCANSLSGVVNTFEDQSKSSLLKGGDQTDRFYPSPNNSTSIWTH